MRTGKMKKLDVWGKVKKINELNETDYVTEKIKSVYLEMIPMTGSVSSLAGNTKVSGTTHKLKGRYVTCKFIKEDMWFIRNGIEYEIKFILNPFEANKELEFFCEVS